MKVCLLSVFLYKGRFIIKGLSRQRYAHYEVSFCTKIYNKVFLNKSM